MVQTEHKQKAREADLTGQTMAEAQRLFQSELGFNKKAAAVLNGIRVSGHRESATVLHGDDTLVFRTVSHRVAHLLGALLMAAAITGGVFASGFMNGSTMLSGTIQDANFAEVSINSTTTANWTVYGGVKGSTGNATLFEIDSAASGYTSDLVPTVSLGNADELITVYRNMSLSLELRDGSGSLVDINEDGYADAGDFMLLTLDNGSVTIPFEQTTAQIYTLWLKGGSYIAQVHSARWTGATAAPLFFAEIAQR